MRDSAQTGGTPVFSGGNGSGNKLPIGTTLHEFEILGLIGEGGFSFVYLAHDQSLQRVVALKEYVPASLATRLHDGRVVARTQQYEETFQAGLRSFVNEARLLARFDHPALLKVYRFWEGNGTAYMAMPYYEGTTLKEMVRGGSAVVNERWLKELFAPITDALDILHAANCYHRDISPDNIQVLKNGMPLLLDFGAARRIIGDMTHGVTVILKPGYAPIEQYADDESGQQGPWTDIYALSAVIYFCVTGKSPPPSVARSLKDSLPSLTSVANARYSHRFLRGIERGLAVLPGDRPQSISELRALLDMPLYSRSSASPGWTPERSPHQQVQIQRPSFESESKPSDRPLPPPPIDQASDKSELACDSNDERSGSGKENQNGLSPTSVISQSPAPRAADISEKSERSLGPLSISRKQALPAHPDTYESEARQQGSASGSAYGKHRTGHRYLRIALPVAAVAAVIVSIAVFIHWYRPVSLSVSPGAPEVNAPSLAPSTPPVQSKGEAIEPSTHSPGNDVVEKPGSSIEAKVAPGQTESQAGDVSASTSSAKNPVTQGKTEPEHSDGRTMISADRPQTALPDGIGGEKEQRDQRQAQQAPIDNEAERARADQADRARKTEAVRKAAEQQRKVEQARQAERARQAEVERARQAEEERARQAQEERTRQEADRVQKAEQGRRDEEARLRQNALRDSEISKLRTSIAGGDGTAKQLESRIAELQAAASVDRFDSNVGRLAAKERQTRLQLTQAELAVTQRKKQRDEAELAALLNGTVLESQQTAQDDIEKLQLRIARLKGTLEQLLDQRADAEQQDADAKRRTNLPLITP